MRASPVRRRLKLLRAAVALAMFAGLTAALVDFRGFAPPRLGHWLASTQFVPSIVALVTGSFLSLACIVIAAATLAAGRIYCSAICPLGILQDVVARLAATLRLRRKGLFPYARPRTWLRQSFLWGTVAGVAAGWAGFAVALIDPYSVFGRIASGIFRPLLTLANNAVVGVANAIGFGGLYRVDPPWAGLGALAIPALMLTLIVLLSAWRGRLYCNTVCPVGTLLGWLSRWAAFRLEIDRNACTKCAACLRACKAQCIDLRGGAIDFSRCVACYNCIGACDQGGIGYRFAWRRRQATPAGASTGSSAMTRAPLPVVSSFWSWAVARASRPWVCAKPSDMGKMPMPLRPLTARKCAALAAAPDPARRAFIAGTAAAVAVSLGAAPRLLARGRDGDRHEADDAAPGRPDSDIHTGAICPPGSAGIDRFLDRCTACQLCISACPTHVLQPAFIEYGFAGLMKPRMDYSKSFCNYDCRACGEVCPTGAITLLDLAEKRITQIGEAQFDEKKCIVKVKGTDCAACSEHCPTKAVNTVPYGNNLRLPKVDRDLCIGCGACEYACPVLPEKAITVASRRLHGRARKPDEKKATAPTPAGDFPF
jgi:ferredoxin